MSARVAPRFDPHCRNCGVPATGNYCPACGQETEVALPTARQFLREAAGRLIAWDGRLWRTLFALAFRPGSLTLAYLAGRRRYFVRPARLFLAMSLILFAVIRLEVGLGGISGEAAFATDELAAEIGDPAAPRGREPRPGPRSPVPPTPPTPPTPQTPQAPSASGDAKLALSLDDKFNISATGIGNAYLREQLSRRFDRFNRLSGRDKVEHVVDGALRYGSYLIVLLLPVFAALQYLTYLGRSGRYPGRPKLYAEHLVYSAHLHTFWALTLIAAIVVPWGPFRVALAAWLVWYVIRAKKAVYGGRWTGRMARTLVVAVAYLAALGFGIVGLLFVSIFLH